MNRGKKIVLTAAFAFFAVAAFWFSAMAADPYFSISQSDVDTGVYAIEVSAFVDEGVLNSSVVLSYDNTVIVPVHSSTHVEQVISATTTQGTTAPFSVDNGLAILPVHWVVDGARTAFNMSAYSYSFSAVDSSGGLTICRFYFKLADGKSLQDMNSRTFRLETDYSEGSMLQQLFVDSSEAVALKIKDGVTAQTYPNLLYKGETSAETSISLLSFVYSNSVAVAPVTTCLGAQIRAAASGFSDMRFVGEISVDDVTDFALLEIGFVIDDGTVSGEYASSYFTIQNVGDNTYRFFAPIYSIPEANYEKDYTARAYVKYMDSGSVKYSRSDEIAVRNVNMFK